MLGRLRGAMNSEAIPPTTMRAMKASSAFTDMGTGSSRKRVVAPIWRGPAGARSCSMAWASSREAPHRHTGKDAGTRRWHCGQLQVVAIGAAMISPRAARALQPSSDVRHLLAVAACTLGLAAQGCATLSQLGVLIQPPRFERDGHRRAELRLQGRGAAVRLWARVQNPNSFGLRLTSLEGDLFLEGSRAAGVDLPLGLPLGAYEDTVIPIDFSIDFEDVPGLLGAAGRVIGREPLAYRLDGSVGVDAGPLGRPRFGPSTLLTGDVQPIR
jgi:hypothetical protein